MGSPAARAWAALGLTVSRLWQMRLGSQSWMLCSWVQEGEGLFTLDD